MLLTLKTPQKTLQRKTPNPYFMPKRILVNPLKKKKEKERRGRMRRG
jgi:hypothetical protein